jgi:predicted nuclease of predicted toxin-antitoxin system
VKLKLDENVHTDVAPALRALGHDVATVHDQGLAGRPDADLARAVRAEGRGLVTFDLDFADPRLCPPAQFAGLVVLRLGAPTARHQIAALTRFLAETTDIAGRLWIVEHTRARDWTP